MKKETKQILFDSFYKLYQTNDIDEINVNMISQISGYHRSTFYYYFEDIYDLRKQYENYILQNFFSSWQDSISIENKDNMEVYLTEFIKCYQKYGDILTLLIRKNPEFTLTLQNSILSMDLSEDLRNEPMSTKIAYIVPAMISLLNTWYCRGKDIPLSLLIEKMGSLF